jgi:hypothetical protein
VIAHDFVIENNGRQLVLYVATLVIDEPRRVVVARLDRQDIVSVESQQPIGRRNCQVSIPRQKSLTAAQQVFETAQTAELL